MWGSVVEEPPAIVAVGSPAVVGTAAAVVGSAELVDAAGVVDGAALGVVCAGAGLEVVVAGLDVAVCDPEPPLPPEKGSVYCWSPAEPPARLTAGTASATRTSSSMPARAERERGTARVLQARGRLGSRGVARGSDAAVSLQ